MSEQFNYPYFNPNWQPKYNLPGYSGGKPAFSSINSNNYDKFGRPIIKFNNQQNLEYPEQTNQFNAGGVLQSVTGAIDLGLNIASMDDEAKSIATQAPSMMYDASGNPVYNLNQFAINTNSIKPRGASAGEVLGGFGKGAAVGASLGNIIPGLGTVVGGAVGGVIGGIGSFFGGRRRKKKMREAKRKANISLRKKQINYNEAALSTNQYNSAMRSYQDQLNNTNRLMNLYGDN